MSEQTLRLFVSSPGDVAPERRRIDLVVERLNAEFAGRVRIETVRWERSYYSAHDTFQKQIPEAADCDVVIAVFRGRLGTPLPAEFPTLPDGEPYPSGTAYEVLSAIEVRRGGKRVPDVYVFRYPAAPTVELDAPDRAEIEAQWGRLKRFFDRWFRNQAGEFLAAFQTYASTDDFAQKAEDCLRQWLARRGYLAQGTVWDRVLLGSPFPGLAAFDASRGPVFFGREQAIGQALGRLRETFTEPGRLAGRVPFLMLIGASGSGKSSLLRAGLLPRLVLPGSIPDIDLWRSAVMTPGADPFASLADALFADAALGAELRAGMFRTREMLARQLAGTPDMAIMPVRDALERAAAKRQQDAGFDAPRPACLALGIDQAERLFTEATPETAAALAGLLSALVRQGLATVIMAVRSDAYARFQTVEALLALREDGATLDLVAPTAAELEEIVTRPVGACHPPLAFEQRDGRSLAARLVADARGGDALPLLQVSLARLYAAEAGRGDGLLRADDYAGLDEAVTQTANDALATLDPAARTELPALVAGLVTDVVTDPRTGAATPVVAALDRTQFEAGQPARAALVEAFVASRLLTAEVDGARPLVRPVHEALLRIWPEAVTIVADTAALIRVRHTLTPLVRAWSEASDKQGHLDLSPALLDGAQALLARFDTDLPAPMRDFIAQAAAADAARRDRERAEQERRIRDAEALASARRRTAQRTMAGMAAAVVLAGLAAWQWHAAGLQRDRAQRSLTLATQTANGLVFDLAQKFRNVVGVPAATIKDILDRARKLQEQLVASGESTPQLQASQADALMETAVTLRTVGDTQAAMAAATEGQARLKALLLSPINVAHDYALSFVIMAQIHQAQGDLKAALADVEVSLQRRRQLSEAHPKDLERLSDVAQSYDVMGDVQRGLGDNKAALVSYRASYDIAKRLLLAAPGDVAGRRNLAVSEDKLGLAHKMLINFAAAKAYFQASLALSNSLTEQNPNDAQIALDAITAQSNLGTVQQAQGDYPAALASDEQSLGKIQRLVDSDPSNSDWRRDLALAHERISFVHQLLGQISDALASAQAALDIRKALVTMDQNNAIWLHDLELSYNEVALANFGLHKVDDALANHHAALEIAIRVAKLRPDMAAAHWDVATAEAVICLDHQQQLDPTAALESCKAGLDEARQATALRPDDAMLQHTVAQAHLQVGTLEDLQRDAEAALASYRAALAVATAVDEADRPRVLTAAEQADLHGRIGRLCLGAGDLPAAAAELQAAITLLQTVAAREPANMNVQQGLAIGSEYLARVQQLQDDPAAALASYRSALAIRQQIADSAPDSPVRQFEVAHTLAVVGEVALEQGDHDGGLAMLHRGREIVTGLLDKQPGNTALVRQLGVLDGAIDAVDAPN